PHPRENHLPTRVPVAVIISCYRCATTIPRALESVARQTALPEEVLLVDDGSCDETLDTLKVLAERYRYDLRITIIALPQNSGCAVARNTAWEQTKQQFLAFLDADDAWHSKKLEIQYQWMQTHSETILSGHGTVFLQPGQAAPALRDKWQA